MKSPEDYKLPENYYFVDQNTISPDEIIELRDASDWGSERDPNVWQNVLAQSLATVGTRSIEGKLVGIGFLVGNVRHAIFCDFTVHPDHRSKGIGKAILSKRIEIADELGIPYRYTDIGETNYMRHHYYAVGFVAASNVLERKSR